MKIAIASDKSDINGDVSMHGARAAFYLVFDDAGKLDRTLENPFASIERGAGPRVADFLADSDVDEVVAGDFGSRFEVHLEDLGIKTRRNTGNISDVVKQLTE